MGLGGNRRYFLLLCVGERRALYEQAVKQSGYEFVLVDGLLPLLTNCVQEPPQALLVDAVSAAKMGAALVNPLFELRMAWPVMRCTLRHDGTIVVMCESPDRQGSLAEAMAGIAAGDPTWLPPWHRRSVRVEVRCRTRLRARGQDEWHPGNCLNLARDGAFVVSYRPYGKGDALEMELWDIAEKPACLSVQVVRCRRWEEGPRLPGIGVAFDHDTIPEHLGKLIATRLSARLCGLRT